jgi:hypothetical protein
VASLPHLSQLYTLTKSEARELIHSDHAILAHSLSTTQIGNGDNILEALNHASKANASKHDAADNSDGSTSPPAKTQRTTAPPSALRKAHGASWRQQGHVEFAVSEGRSDLVLVGQGKYQLGDLQNCSITGHR